MTKKSLRNLLNRCARLLDASANGLEQIIDQHHVPAIRVPHRDQLRTTAKECRDAAAKGISA